MEFQFTLEGQKLAMCADADLISGNRGVSYPFFPCCYSEISRDGQSTNLEDDDVHFSNALPRPFPFCAIVLF